MPAAIHAWTEQDRQTVAELLLAGKSARLIGMALGLTRNAVIGKLYRDEKLHALVGQKYSQVKIEREKPPKPKRSAIPSLKSECSKHSVADGIPSYRPDKQNDVMHIARPAMHLVPLLELTRCQCRFPVEDVGAAAIGGYLFCGRPTPPDEIYCREHRAIASPGRREP